ncbi:MAG TPA: superoxide dismutase [Gammaproteobacteria bacterium]|nr:superoxide dismutase [Gammaproteobacteria bacterium]
MSQYALPDLPYDLDALEPHLSAEILELHYKKHHAGYVKGANDTLDKLADAREQREYAHIGQLEKSLAFHISGHVLHSLLWKNMSPQGGGTPNGGLGAALDQHFGSFDAFKSQLTSAAETVQGSGWGALSWEPLGKRLVVEQVFDHQGNVGNGALPILVIDMWEHAYYLQYQNRKKEWLDGFWQLVNWTDVAERFTKVQRTDIGL